MKMKNFERRAFLKTAGAVGVFTILKPHLVRGSEANSAVRVGLPGMRPARLHGTPTPSSRHTGARMTALADLFQISSTRLKSASMPPRRPRAIPACPQTWVGPHGLPGDGPIERRGCGGDRDPAYFHPEHLRVVVEAGKHVYLEKARSGGCRRREARAGDPPRRLRAIPVSTWGFQIRSAPPYIELVRRIHAGALGEIAAGEAHYYCPAPTTAAGPEPPAMCCGVAQLDSGSRTFRRYHRGAEYPRARRVQLGS